MEPGRCWTQRGAGAARALQGRAPFPGEAACTRRPGRSAETPIAASRVSPGGKRVGPGPEGREGGPAGLRGARSAEQGAAAEADTLCPPPPPRPPLLPAAGGAVLGSPSLGLRGPRPRLCQPPWPRNFPERLAAGTGHQGPPWPQRRARRRRPRLGEGPWQLRAGVRPRQPP